MIKKLVQRYAHSSKELIPGFRKTLPIFRFYQNMLPRLLFHQTARFMLYLVIMRVVL